MRSRRRKAKGSRSHQRCIRTSDIRLPTSALGIFLIASGLAILLLIYFPIITLEIGYRLHSQGNNQSAQSARITPIDEEFSIIIPKIGANARVVKNVDPYNAREYQHALTQGVAHAKGTVFPGQVGNIFIFSHSSSDFLTATRYNSVFYLLDKLTPGDKIIIVYQSQYFTYTVVEKKIVNPKEVEYLNDNSDDPTLTLMTCWPPGTTLKRLIVQAKIDEK